MNDTYNGWSVQTLNNEWLTLQVVPQLGGRLIQLALGDYPFLFVNPALADYEPDETRLGANGAWLNYGGEKIWPAPQGWNSPELWPGPPDPVLDGGAYAFEKGGRSLTLTSPYDQHTGLHISRTVTLSEDAAEIKIRVEFKNQSDTLRHWAIWPVCQVQTPLLQAVKVICPTNPESVFPQGFKVVHGLVNNPQFGLNSAGHLQVDYQYLVGKVILDAEAGWVAAVNCTNGKVLLMCYEFESGKEYPDHASVHIWTQGKGMIYSRNRILEFSDETPPYLEMELVSPLKELLPGHFSEFGYKLKTTTIPPDSVVVAVRQTGVIAQLLTISKEGNTCQLRGKYGVFQNGLLKLVSQSISVDILTELSVSPLEGVELDVTRNLTENPARLLLEFWNEKGQFVEHLDLVNF